MGCEPPWFIANQTCPFGSVCTWPYTDFTVPAEPTLADHVAVCYIILPVVIQLCLVFLVIARRHAIEILWILFTALVVLVALLVKCLTEQPRPRSCLLSCGMPSGHSCYAVGLFSVALWDSAVRNELPQRERTVRAVALAVLLLPVPWAQVRLGDHSAGQAFAGASLGVVGAVLWIIALGPWCEVFLESYLIPAMDRVCCTPFLDSSMAANLEPVLDLSLLELTSDVSARNVTLQHHPEGL